jgi:hypothetical protein
LKPTFFGFYLNSTEDQQADNQQADFQQPDFQQPDFQQPDNQQADNQFIKFIQSGYKDNTTMYFVVCMVLWIVASTAAAAGEWSWWTFGLLFFNTVIAFAACGIALSLKSIFERAKPIG